MKQKLLTDIELDVLELKCLMNSFSKEPTQTLSELLKRSISQMQGRLEELSAEVDTVQIPSLSSTTIAEIVPPVNDPIAIEEIVSVVVAEEKPTPIEETLVAAEQEESLAVAGDLKSPVLGENIKFLSIGLRQSISLNDTFRFSREIFGGDSELMNRVVEQLSAMSAYGTAIAYLSSKVNMNEENEALVDFVELLKKFFNEPA